MPGLTSPRPTRRPAATDMSSLASAGSLSLGAASADEESRNVTEERSSRFDGDDSVVSPAHGEGLFEGLCFSRFKHL